MKHFLSITILFVFTGWLAAQQGGLVNNGVRLVIPENTKLDIDGNQQAAYVNNENGTIELGGTFAIEGNWVNNSTQSNVFTYYGPNAEIIFDGSEDQTIGDTTSDTWNALTISSNFHLSQDLTILNELKMENGIIYLEDNNLIVNNEAIITPVTDFSNENMFVTNGTGKVVYHINENGTYLFPLGSIVDEAVYSPATVNFSLGNYGENAKLMAHVTPEKHPNITNENNYLNRYWTISQEDVANMVAEVSMAYHEFDVNGTDEGFWGMHWTDQWYELEDVINNEIFGTVNQFGDFTAIGQETGLPEGLEEEIIVYLNNGTIHFKNADELKGADVLIYNTIGQLIATSTYSGSPVQLSSNLNGSFCIVNIKKEGFNFSKIVYSK